MINPLISRNPPASTAGKIAALLLLIVVAFQGALAAGAPWGAATQGGSNEGVLPNMLRVGSVITLFIYAALAVVAGTSHTPATLRRRVLYAAATVMVLATLLNIASTSFVERIIWAPVTIALVIALWNAARHESITPPAHRHHDCRRGLGHSEIINLTVAELMIRRRARKVHRARTRPSPRLTRTKESSWRSW